MKRTKRIISILIALTMILGIFVGCAKQGTKKEGDKPQTTAADSKGEDKKSDDKVDDSNQKEPYKMVIELWNMLDSPDIVQALEEVQGLEKFSHIEFEVLEKQADYLTKMPITIASGQQRDLVGVFNPIQKAQYAKADTIIPIDEYIDELGVDFQATFGNYADQSKSEGKTVMVPYGPTSWAMYYNKKIFDDAGIPYPDQKEPMTWQEYKELAKKLTSGEGDKKIYGALHLDWPMFWYGEAIMKLGGGTEFYNEEGLSNIEDPAFAGALKRTYDMMHDDKSIPTHADIIVSKTNATAFMNGKYGLYLQGPWLLNWAVDKETYPRDWKLGICPMPVDEGSEDRKTWGVVGGLAVPQTAVNPKESVEVAIEITRIGGKYVKAQPPTNQTVEPEGLYVEHSEILSPEGVTKDIITDAFANPDIQFLVEKVTGKNPSDYEKVINEEVEKYFVKEQDLETTIINIKERGDKAITAE